MDTAERDLDLLERLGGRLVTPHDAEWPSPRLGALQSAAPLALWVRGRGVLPPASQRAVALTGTRAATAYGEHVASQVAGDLAVAGCVTISGCAYGIDAAIHRGTIGLGLPSVAVIPGGLDRAYPSRSFPIVRRHRARRGGGQRVCAGCPPQPGAHARATSHHRRLVRCRGDCRGGIA
ncbi:DNA-protecting protein DprA [Rhodococcus opacus]|nr:DNA-protecting protein DprA [Rhodococcus opacus]